MYSISKLTTPKHKLNSSLLNLKTNTIRNTINITEIIKLEESLILVAQNIIENTQITL